MSALWAMAWNGYREARRNRVTMVVGGFALVMLLSSSLVANVTVWTFDRVLTDFGLSVMAFILVGLAIFLSCGLLPREIERRTIFMIVSRPVSRSKFLVARLAGNVLTLLILMALMFALMAAEILVLRSPITQPMVLSLVGLAVELVVLTAAGFFFSSFSGQIVSVICTVALYFAGHLSVELWRLADRAEAGSARLLLRSVYYLLPNLEKMNYRPFAAYATPVPAEMVLRGAAYGLGYAAVLTVLACLIFERRDFK